MKRFLMVVCILAGVGLLSYFSPPSSFTQDQAVVAEERAKELVLTGVAREVHKPDLFQLVMSSQAAGADGEIFAFKQKGERVKKGDEVIAAKYLPGRARELKATLDQAKAQLEAAKHDFQKKKKSYEILAPLEKLETIAKIEFSDSFRDFQQATWQVTAAEMAVIAADERSSPYNLVAHMDGEVIWTNPDWLWAGFTIQNYQSPVLLMKLADLRSMEVAVPGNLADAHISQVNAGGHKLKVIGVHLSGGTTVVQFSNPDLSVKYGDKVDVASSQK